MSKKHILILLALILVMLLLPSKVKGDTDTVIETPIEVIEVVELTPRQKILAAFPDAPIMLRVAIAESGSHGEPCKNNINAHSSARGCFQILRSTWVGAHCTGDVMNVDDNISCAQKLYKTSGTTPWLESKGTWSK